MRITFSIGKLLFKALKVLHGREDYFNSNFNLHNPTLTKLQKSPSKAKCSIQTFIRMVEFAWIVQNAFT